MCLSTTKKIQSTWSGGVKGHEQSAVKDLKWGNLKAHEKENPLRAVI